MTAVAHHDLGTGAVVRGEEDERVPESAHGLELLDNAADLTIHSIHHRRVDRHLRRLEPPLLLRQLAPRQRAVDLAGPQLLEGLGKVIRRADLGLKLRKGRIDQPISRCRA